MFETSKLEDADPAETREWLESIDSVLKTQGAERAQFLLERIIDFTRRSGAYLPFRPNTAYVNTISPGQELDYPGDRAIERRIEAYLRWNAMAMVVQANRQSSEYGGHIATYASAATLYEVGFNHFWRAPSEQHPGDLVFIQGHSSPGIYARAYLEGRLTEDAARPFPPGSGRRRPVVLPAPVADAGLLAVPDRVDGPRPDDGDLPGALHALPRASRHRASQRPQGLGLPRRRRDGRARIARRHHDAGAREARQPGLRHQLQPAAARRPGARQRQDHPGTRGRVPRRRLERHQGGVGRALGSAAAAGHQGPAAAPDEGVRRRRVPELQGQGRRLHARALLRQVSRAEGDGRQHVRRGHLAPEPRRPRRPQGLRRLRGGDEAQRPADRDPRQDRQGLRHGRTAARRRTSRTSRRSSTTQRCASSATASTSRSRTPRSRSCRTTSRPKTARRCGTCSSAASRSAATCRSASDRAPPLRTPPLEAFAPLLERPASARSRPRWRSCACSRSCSRTRTSGSTSCRSCRTRRAPSAWRACSARSASTPRWASSTRRRTRTSCSYYREDKKGQILEEGINEGGAMCCWIAAAHRLRQPRRQHDAVLHLLLDVRLPAHRRLHLGRRRHAGARLPAGRHRRAHDAGGRGPAAPGRPQPPGGVDHPELRRLRPGLRLRAGRDRAGRPAPHVRRARVDLLLHHLHERELRAAGDAGGRGGGHPQGHVPAAAGRQGQGARAAARLRHDPARGARPRPCSRRTSACRPTS